MTRHQELLAYPFPRRCPQPLAQRRVEQEPLQRFLEVFQVARVVQQQAVHAVVDLVGDATDVARNNRPALPHGLRHGESESFVQALLHDDARVPLERVHHRRVLLRVLHGQRHQVHDVPDAVRQCPPRGLNFVEHALAFRVIRHPVDVRAYQYKFRVPRRSAIGQRRKRLHDPRVVLQRVPARDLHHQWRIPVWRPAHAHDVCVPVHAPRRTVLPREHP
ncbi:MAG: hypothetical protein U5Q44_05750 [Dehalococcoidia bacterium]|nr:hypothetical protein [Dehalococcoidia bacterium]